MPAYVPARAAGDAPARQPPRRFFFVALERPGKPVSGARGKKREGGRRGTRRVPFSELELGVMIGRGAYGRVYRGVYRGEQVAVKVPGPHGIGGFLNCSDLWLGHRCQWQTPWALLSRALSRLGSAQCTLMLCLGAVLLSQAHSQHHLTQASHVNSGSLSSAR